MEEYEWQKHPRCKDIEEEDHLLEIKSRLTVSSWFALLVLRLKRELNTTNHTVTMAAYYVLKRHEEEFRKTIEDIRFCKKLRAKEVYKWDNHLARMKW